MKIQAAVATAPQTDLDIRELALDAPRADEVTVRMVASGVCHTDAIVRDQWYPVPLPAVLGHEGSGIVEAVGADVIDLKVGDKVVLAPASCGVCENCISGHPQYCTDFFALNFGGSRADGSKMFDDNGTPISSNFFGQSSFASMTNVRARNAVKVSDDAPLELLGPLGCGIMTGSGSVLNVLKPGPGESIAVFGTGAVGLAGMLAAVASGATTIIMVDIVPSRLEFAKELGATHVVNSKDVDAVEAIREITGGRGVQYALDTTGVPAVFAQMTKSLALRGHGVLVGAAKLGTEAPFDIGTLLTSGITISMVVEGDAVPREFIPKLISLYQRGLFPFDKLVKTYAFTDINSAFADSESGATIKPVVLY
ncbi:MULTISPECIES: NAD(P)-dependent alcohol dehydrogenase [unclassified Leucobacter]|uniref:NAD(P)-dependent alcohol dehydrogenase n=1 Tax=unclassified Leucobacter TaxID=2621730 RepID=UPI00165D6DDF|nr:MULTISPECIES: NAD(P)-dependent alcohol dehydrogenase [unclassified Leucobacter]MBC9926267.1 NAD(P)-dependent alcohol dehydrogenase [Leucobacter sp. cx-169]